MADETVVDNTAEQRFELEAEGHRAELLYQLDGDQLVLVHTGVPDELEGRGLGGQLAKAAVERARAEGLTVVPRCSFVRSWIERHPDEVAGVEVA
ncbi:MAG: GNAT family N-acetyltransferase [Acidimicrobiales bacterium]|nr:GNAT family N-acetyltransferase [Acidimicrobiales bacterium]